MNSVRFSMAMRGFLVLALVMVAVGCTPKVTLTIDVEPDGAGTVTRDPARDTYRKGDSVTLTAVPAEGNAFSEWDGDLSGTENPVVLTLDKNTQVIARFTVPEPLEGEGEQPEGEGEQPEGEGEPEEGEGEPSPEEEFPHANFSAAPLSGVWPLVVTFTDHSEAGSSDITGWLWDFGDGNKSMSQHPTHLYRQAGVYSVSLTVFSESGANTYIADNLINVEDAVDSDGDGIPDWLEAELGTDPNKWDTSGDGFSDGALYYGGSNPLVSHGTLAPQAVILESNPELRLLEVGEDYLIFETPATKAELLQPGKILVSSRLKEDVVKKNIFEDVFGFFRRVKEVVVDGVTTLVVTTNAAIQEVWPTLDLAGSYSITLDTASTELHDYLNDYEIFTHNWQSAELVVFTKDGRFLFTAIISYHLTIEGGGIKLFRTKLDGDATVQLGAAVNVNGRYTPPIPDVTLAKVPIPIGSTPIVVELSASVGLDLSLYGEVYAYAWFKSTSKMTVGAEYRDGRLYDLSSVDLPKGQRRTRLEVFATADATVYLKPRMDISLYGRAGAYAQVNPYLSFYAEYPCTPETAPTLDIGIYGEVGVYVDLFLWEIAPEPIYIPKDPIERRLYTFSCGELNSGGDEGETGEGESSEGEHTEGETSSEGESGEGEVIPGDMVYVPAGSFAMGDPWDEGDTIERPVHVVTLSAYEIGKYEVTNQEYADILNWANARYYLDLVAYNTVNAYGVQLLNIGSEYCQIKRTDSGFIVNERDGYSMANHPVVEVTWYGAAVYCNWLSESQGLTPCYNTNTWECDFTQNGYHLPTEACLLYTSPSPRDRTRSRMPSSA